MNSNGAGRLPNLIIAGVTKGGTTSLFRYLGQHPEVCPSDLKELRYFLPLRYGEQVGELDGYRQHFRHSAGERYAMEATPGYFYGGRALAEGLRDTLPGARVVVSLREPGDRCWSWYRFVHSRARIPKEMDFHSYLDRCEQMHEAGVDHLRENQPFWGLGGGCYDEWIDAWLEVFGNRLRVEWFEDLARDPRAVVRGLCGWLDVDSTAMDGIRYEVENKTEQYRNRPLQRTALYLNRRGERFFARHRSLKRTLRGAYYRINRDDARPRLDAAARQRLAAFYAPHNRRFAAALQAAGVPRPPAWVVPAGGIRS